MAKRYELNDQQSARIAEMLPGKKSDPGRTAKDKRSSLDSEIGAQRDELTEWAGVCRSHRMIPETST
jgi:hypothetical protein